MRFVRNEIEYFYINFFYLLFNKKLNSEKIYAKTSLEFSDYPNFILKMYIILIIIISNFSYWAFFATYVD